MESSNHFICKIMACVSIISAYIGTMIPTLLYVTEHAMPFLQAGSFIIGMGAGLVSIWKSLKKKK